MKTEAEIREAVAVARNTIETAKTLQNRGAAMLAETVVETFGWVLEDSAVGTEEYNDALNTAIQQFREIKKG